MEFPSTGPRERTPGVEILSLSLSVSLCLSFSLSFPRRNDSTGFSVMIREKLFDRAKDRPKGNYFGSLLFYFFARCIIRFN